MIPNLSVDTLLMSTPNEFFDTHCHFDFSTFAEDREKIWQGCAAVGVNGLLIPGLSPEQWQSAAQLSEKNKGIFFAAGIHPWWIEKNNAADLSEQYLATIHHDLCATLTAPKCVAVGECGLDAMIKTPLLMQQKILDVHLQVASDLTLPLIIHCRKAHNELLSQLKNYTLIRGGVIHAFSGSIELANQYWSLGFYLGVGGTITYARANKTRAAVKQLPIEAMVLETDAPDMPLSGQQGQRNSPENIPIIAQALATIRNESIHYIAQRTTQNARTLFGLSL